LELEGIGEVMHLAKSGRLIVRLQEKGKHIKSGELLIDSNGKRVGKVIEVIGPVNSPYASVAPSTDKTKKIIGSSVFSGGFSAKRRDFRPNVRRQQKNFGRYKKFGEKHQ
jgi:RNA-binding protein